MFKNLIYTNIYMINLAKKLKNIIKIILNIYLKNILKKYTKTKVIIWLMKLNLMKKLEKSYQK